MNPLRNSHSILLIILGVLFLHCTVSPPEIAKNDQKGNLAACNLQCAQNYVCYQGQCIDKNSLPAQNNEIAENNQKPEGTQDLTCISDPINETLPATANGCIGIPPLCDTKGVCVLCQQLCVGEIFVACDYYSIPNYESPEKSCSDLKDNDCDGLDDCADSDCASDWQCQKVPECFVLTPEGNAQRSTTSQNCQCEVADPILVAEFGDGKDGDITILKDTNLNNEAIAGSRVSVGTPDGIIHSIIQVGENSVTLSSSPNGLAVGDEVLLYGFGQSTLGNYEFKIIACIIGNTLVFYEKVIHTYETTAMFLQRVPHYQNVTVSANTHFQAIPFTQNKGGIFAIRVLENLTVKENASIDMSAAGFLPDQGLGAGKKGGNGGYANQGDGGGGGGGGGGSHGTKGQPGGGGGGGGGDQEGCDGNGYGNIGGIGGNGGSSGSNGADGASAIPYYQSGPHGLGAGSGGGGGGSGNGFGGVGQNDMPCTTGCGSPYGSFPSGNGGSYSLKAGQNGQTTTTIDGMSGEAAKNDPLSNANGLNNAGGGGAGGLEGEINGDDMFSKIYFGSGAGSGGIAGASNRNSSGNGGNAGNGGGIIFLFAKQIDLLSSAFVKSSGGNGGNAASSDPSRPGAGGGGGSGGAGGSILIHAETANIGNQQILAIGGDAGLGQPGKPADGNWCIMNAGSGGNGGKGGDGRIRIEYKVQLNGSTLPPAITQQKQ